MKKRYTLDGVVVATDWYGRTGYIHLRIYTNEKGLEEIKKNPLQDYIAFGVQSVDYVLFDVYLTEVEERDDCTIKKEYHEPIETIEEGDPSWVKEQGDDFLLDVWETEPAIVHY